MTFVHRYDEDTSAPTFREWRSDLGRRALLPALLLWAVIVGLGFLITGPLDDIPAEDAVNETLQDERNPVLNGLTSIWSNIGATLFIITTCTLAIALILWRTRQWWLAAVPAIAVSVQAAVFVTSAAVVGRERPEVEHLDDSPPTSSFPSGHVGASTAFYLTLALLSRRIKHPFLRWAATTVCLLIPALVAYARLYRGMHHLSDVLVGMINGIVCAYLAWHYLRREEKGGADDVTTTSPSTMAPATAASATTTSSTATPPTSTSPSATSDDDGPRHLAAPPAT